MNEKMLAIFDNVISSLTVVQSDVIWCKVA